MSKEPFISNLQEVDSLPRRSKGHLLASKSPLIVNTEGTPRRNIFKNLLPHVFMQSIVPLRTISLICYKFRYCRADQKFLTSQEADIHAFYDGVETITENLWPVIFIPLFSYDFFNYFKHSNNRYEMRLLDLMLGLPKNYDYRHAVLAANLGVDIPGFWSYWLWGSMISMALLLGLRSCFRSRPDASLLIDNEDEKSSEYWMVQRRKRYLLEYDFDKEENADYEYEKQKVYEAFEKKVENFPGLSVAVTLSRELDLNHFASRALFSIYILIHHREYFAWKMAVDAFAEIALHRHDRMGEFALNTLIELAGYNPYIHYKLWSIGWATNRTSLLCNYFIALPLLFITLHWWTLNVTKIAGVAVFFKNRKDCLDQGKIWGFNNVVGNYVCSFCDWKFVDFRSSNLPQSCLDGLLSFEQDSQKIIDGLQALRRYGPYTKIDFSSRAWFKIDITQWQQIWQILQAAPFNAATFLNLSQSVQIPINSEYYAAIAQALKVAALTTIDFSNLAFDPSSLNALLSGFVSNFLLQNLNFSNCQLMDDGVISLMNVSSTMSGLRNLILRNNQLSGLSIEYINGAINKLSLEILDISNNKLISTDIIELSLTPALRKLDISDMDFSDLNTAYFGEKLSNSSIYEFIANNNNLSDSQMEILFPFIANSNISILIISDNKIGTTTLQAIAHYPNKSLEVIYLDNNRLDDSSMRALAIIVSENVNLRTLSISGNAITIDGLSALMQGVLKSQLIELNLARIPLGDDCIPYLFPVLNTSNIQILDLNHIDLTSSGSANLFNYLSQCQLKKLDLSGNEIGSAAGKPLKSALEKSPLKELKFASAKIHTSDISETISAIPSSQLIKLDLSDNFIGNDFLNNLSVTFVPSIHNPQKLSESQDDLDLNRKLMATESDSKLEFMNLEKNPIDIEGTISICRVLPSTLIPTNQLNVNNSLINNTIVTNINGCPYIPFHTYTSSTLCVQPQNLLLMLPLILLAFNGPHKQIAPLIKFLLVGLMIIFLVKLLNAGPISLLSGAAFFAYQNNKKFLSKNPEEKLFRHALG